MRHERPTHGLWLVCALCALALLACSDDEGGDDEGGDQSDGGDLGDLGDGGDLGDDSSDGDVVEAATATRFVSFNAGLVPNFVDWAAERVAPVSEAIAALDADVVCLQEVWSQEDLDAVLAASADAFPHSYHVDTSEAATGGPACTQEERDLIEPCVFDNCADAESLSDCAVEFCSDVIFGSSSACQQCLIANISRPLEEIITTCAEGSSVSYIFDGRNGLALLSRVPLEVTAHEVLPSYTTRRVVLHARVEGGPEGAPLDVFCTHLSAALSDVPYGGAFESWADEQANQIDLVEGFVEAQAGVGSPAILMGDMNTGPELAPEISAELAENYERFIAAGWGAPYIASQSAPPCTWCSANTLVEDTDGDAIIDHILTRGLEALEVSAGRLLDAAVDVAGVPAPTHLSDHHGVYVELSAP